MFRKWNCRVLYMRRLSMLLASIWGRSYCKKRNTTFRKRIWNWSINLGALSCMKEICIWEVWILKKIEYNPTSKSHSGGKKAIMGVTGPSLKVYEFQERMYFSSGMPFKKGRNENDSKGSRCTRSTVARVGSAIHRKGEVEWFWGSRWLLSRKV